MSADTDYDVETIYPTYAGTYIPAIAGIWKVRGTKKATNTLLKLAVHEAAAEIVAQRGNEPADLLDRAATVVNSLLNMHFVTDFETYKRIRSLV